MNTRPLRRLTNPTQIFHVNKPTTSPMHQPLHLHLRLARARFEDHTSQVVHFVADQESNAFLNDLETNHTWHTASIALSDLIALASPEKFWAAPDTRYHMVTFPGPLGSMAMLRPLTKGIQVWWDNGCSL